jgi:hypothetical protein
VLWRGLGFSIVNAAMSRLFTAPPFGEALAVGYGLMYSIAGGVSLVVGGLTTRAVARVASPNSAPQTVSATILGFMVAAVLSHVALSIVVHKRERSLGATSGDNAADDALELEARLNGSVG